MSSIVWTTLPVSIDSSGNGNVSVFVTPKLTENVLGYPWTDWPSVIQNASFQVHLYNTVNPNPLQTVTATVQNAAPAFDSVLWAEIFPPAGMTVKPFQFSDNSKREMWSYPVDQVHENIKSVYASVHAQTPTALPTINWNTPGTPLMKLIDSYAAANALRAETRQSLGMQKWVGNWAARNAAELAAMNANAFSPGLTALQKAVWLGKRFYDRPSPNKDVHNNLNAVPVMTAPTYDFNERIAILADHPALMRRLGLVVDLKFTFNGPATGFVQVVPSLNDRGQYPGTHTTPRTAYESSGARFATRAGSVVDSADALDVVQGMVPLEDTSRFYVTTGDPDGTMHKTVDFASNMANIVTFIQNEATKSATPATPPAEGLPARRNTGFTVTRKGRAAVLQSRLQRVAALQASFDNGNNKPDDLFTHDVVRGYRVDVQNTTTGAWASLHRRVVTYAYNGAPIKLGTVNDEGYIKSASGTSDPDPNGPNDLYVHEKLFGWHGWSLSASRPGQTIQPDSTVGPQNNTPQDPTFPVASIVRVAPGTLPAMRYGQTYRLRARAVDLAGNSLSITDANAYTHETAPVAFGRVEPVPPPVLIYPSGVTEGESLETLVIRSDPNEASPMDATAMAASLNAAYVDPTNPLQYTDQGNVYKAYFPNCDRHVAPPKESQVFAEMHGDFDGAFFNGADLDAWYRKGTREEGTFMDTRIASLNDPSNQGYTGNLNNPIVVRPPQVPADQPPPVPSAGSVVANRGDALAAGEYVICQPPAGFVSVPYLPDSMAAGGVVWDPANPAANVWSWTYAGGQNNDYSIWPNYSCLRLSLTQAPLGAQPSFTPAGAASTPGTLVAALPPATILTLKYASTARKDRLGQLEYVQDYNPQDDVTDGRHWMVTPSRTITLIHAVQKPLAAPKAALSLVRNYNDTFSTHTINLQSHSKSTGQVDVAGEWLEYIDDITQPGPTYPITTGRAYSLTIAYGQDDLIQRGMHHEFGDTKHRSVKYTPTATTRYKEFFPPGIINDPTKISIAGSAPSPQLGGLYDVLSSSRPHAPKVAYVVPTFGWSTPKAGSSVRTGGGLRIYLERPWYSSGGGELLGVIVAPSQAALPAAIQPFVSMWGRDPVWDSPSNGALTPAAFTNAPGGTVQAVLSENGQAVTVLPFQTPIYHPGKKLWYVDVDLNPGQTYYPFVSLALVRYQKNSLEGISISAVTRANFAQLVPDRTFTAAAVAGGVSVTVTGVAADNFFGPQLSGPAQTLPAGYVPAPRSHYLQASIQEQVPGMVGEMGWNTIGNGVQLLGQIPLGGGTAKWTGTVPVPAPTTGAPRRVMVEELEVFECDPTNNNVQLVTPSATRLVYVDHMPVPSGRIVRLP